MNSVKIQGKLTKEIFRADNGWAAFTLSVEKKGSTYSTWVPVYVPSGVASSLENMRLTMKSVLIVEGELDQKKDKTLQVKAVSIRVADQGQSRPADDSIPF